MHVSPLAQVSPQPPQLAFDRVVSAHETLELDNGHAVRPVGQGAHAPAVQVFHASSTNGHRLPHVPQFDGSACRSTQTPPQLVSPAGHGAGPFVQTPPVQVAVSPGPGTHGVEHPPQCWSEVERFAHVPLQSVSGGAQPTAHVPSWHVSPAAHAWPHVPQLLESDDTLVAHAVVEPEQLAQPALHENTAHAPPTQAA
jgi:hypothetical protein